MKQITRPLTLAALALAVLLSLLVAPQAQAQPLTLPGPSATFYAGGTNKAVALSTNTYFRMDVPKALDIAIWANFKFLNAPGAGDDTGIRIALYRDINGALRETNSYATIWVPGNGTTPNASVTNLSLGSVGYLWGRVYNTSTNSHATNLTISYTGKR